MVSVLFVCLGNICRSPTAHGVFETLVERAGLAHAIRVDSAGTGAWHVGNPPDTRSQAAAKQRQFKLDHLRARQVEPSDFEQFDYILAMDQQNLKDLQSIKPGNFAGELTLFLDYSDCTEREVPDPYYGGDAGFEHVLDLVESASEGLLNRIKRSHALS